MDKETGRVEAFSDGVFAIAITLLILEFKVPDARSTVTNLGLAAALIRLWPSFLAFGGSFFAILIMWINHHGLFKMVSRVNSAFLFANGFLLLLVTFVPFPTAVLAGYLNRQGSNTAAAFYCGTFVIINVAYNVLWHTASAGRRLISPDVPQRHLDKIKKAYFQGFFVYLGAALISLWHSTIGLAICLSLWILWATLDYKPEKVSREK